MNRRRVLATLGVGLGGITGCLSGRPTGSTATGDRATADETPTGTDATATPSGSQEPVGDIVVKKAIAYESLMGSGGVLAPVDEQFVVASLPDRDGTGRATYTFETDASSWTAGLPQTRGARNASVAGVSRPFVAFTVPSPLSASNPRIRRAGDGAERQLSADARATLTAPAPRFELDELVVPDSVEAGAPLSVSLSATNVSDTDGRFLAAVYWPTARIADDDESHVVDRTVAAGDSLTASLELATEYTASESGPVTLSVDGHVRASREVRLEKG
ncbi:hypothetical protein [Haloarcula onubensis]|uniref:Uncharacterized protein n=1 Tax=Haloarcula onubensis TaxID=2950539 RepID=A0ABU2FSK2_9EURY|nr:hypothetical protein [Halomicroarcula sp. S3CR25-11]MDS0283131.1 hypothetical protein [Halomicroarcula sp. S3CR25-11]